MREWVVSRMKWNFSFELTFFVLHNVKNGTSSQSFELALELAISNIGSPSSSSSLIVKFASFVMYRNIYNVAFLISIFPIPNSHSPFFFFLLCVLFLIRASICYILAFNRFMKMSTAINSKIVQWMLWNNQIEWPLRGEIRTDELIEWKFEEYQMLVRTFSSEK